MAEFDADAVVRALQQASEETRTKVAQLLQQAGEEFVRDHKRLTRRGRYPSRSAQQARHSRSSLALADSIRLVANQPLLKVFQNTAQHHHLVEYGTALRFDNTRNNAARGRMPDKGQTWVPMAVRNRQRFFLAAEALLAKPSVL